MKSAAAIKAALSHAIADATAHLGGASSRTRKLSFATVVRFLIGAEGGSLAKELHRAKLDCTPSAMSQRRAQISPEVFHSVFDRFNAACEDDATYRGYQIVAVDGTAVNLYCDPAAPSFVQHSSAPEGYNQLHLTPLYSVTSDVFLDAVIQCAPQKDEIGGFIELLNRNTFQKPTIILADRGFESYNLFAHLLEKENTDFIIRVKNNRSALREVARLPSHVELDCDIKFILSTTQTNYDKQHHHIYLPVPKKSKPGASTRKTRWDFQSPYKMALRILRFQLDTGDFETVATSLPRTFTPDDIRELYGMRYAAIETRGFRALKSTVGLELTHGKSDAAVEQEIWAAMTMFNFASRISREAVIRQPDDGVYAYKVNFKMAVALCREYFRDPKADGEKLLQEISKHSVPIRPGRRDERKLRVKGFIFFTYRQAA